jgi:lipopolysaccharide export system protein LptA
MRLLLMLIATVVLIALVGGLYLWMQPSTPRAALPKSATQNSSASIPPPPLRSTPSTTSESDPIVKAGTDVWVEVRDEKTNEVAWQFRASRYDPQPDNTVNVTHPQAEFFFKNGNSVALEGARGRVVIPGDASRSPDLRGATAPPSRGEMYDVTISMFDDERPEHPVLVCKVNNVSFDNDTFRIATEQYTAPDGTVVPADQVPVQVRGDQYDFDGRGLTILWNDKDRHLQLLEIAHGQSMILKPEPTPLPATRPTTRRAQARARSTTAPTTALAEAAPATAPAPTTRKANSQPVYLATFTGGTSGVVVLEDGKPTATAETMKISFRPEDPSDSTETPGTPPARSGARGRRGNAQSSTRPAIPRRGAAPATAPSNANPLLDGEPVAIQWNGPMTVTPVTQDVPDLQPGHQIIEMTSTTQPVTLNHLGSELTCASFVYHDADNSLLVRSSEQVPLITMKSADGAVLKTPALNYIASTGKAVLTGPSSADVPIQPDPNKPAEMLSTRWSDTCTMTLIGQSTDSLAIQSADIVGNVHVEHPQLKLDADELHSGFAPLKRPGKPDSIQLTAFTASGNVKAEMVDENQKIQHMTGNRVELATRQMPDGSFAPGRINVDGDVHAFSEDTDLRAGQMELTLAPTTRPTDQAKVERLSARDNVVFKFDKGYGSANQLDVTTDGEMRHLTLVSTEPLAKLVSGDSTLAGPSIDIDEKRQTVLINGAGTLSGSQAMQQDAKPTPFQVAWSNRLEFSGMDNRATVNGNVVVTTRSQDGYDTAISGQTLNMQLMDDPAAATKPASNPASIAGGFDALQDKTLKWMDLEGNTEVKSVLASPEGQMLRRMHLFAPRVRVEADTHRIIVPEAGRMLLDDRTSTTQPTTAPAAGLGNLRGATAFQWSDKLTYDQSASKAEMSGDVVIVHQDNAANGQPFQLRAPHVAAEFEPRPQGAAPATQPSDEKLRRLVADGGVQFTSKMIQFDAADMVFDPTTETLTAAGTPDTPGHFYDESGISTGTFRTARWNSRTGSVQVEEFQATVPR